MSNPTWLERVESELLRRKLPRQEVARLVTELADHLSDLPSFPQDEPMSTEAIAVESLGSPVEIADTAVREFSRRKNLLGRSRLAAFGTFVLLPLPLLVAAWLISLIAACASLELLQSGLEWSGVLPAAVAGADAAAPDPVDFLGGRFGDVTRFKVLVAHFLTLSVLLVPAAGMAALYGRLAGRTSRRWLWGLTACTLVGLGFGATHYDLTFADQPEKSQLVLMAGIGRHPLRQCGYSLLPLAVGVLVLRRSGMTAEGTMASPTRRIW